MRLKESKSSSRSRERQKVNTRSSFIPLRESQVDVSWFFAHLKKNQDDFDIRDETIHEFDFDQPSLRKRGYSEKIITIIF